MLRGSTSRRWWSHLFLTSSAATLTWGNIVFMDYLSRDRLAFLLYWGTALVFVAAAFGIASLEILLIVREMKSRQRTRQATMDYLIPEAMSTKLDPPASPMS